jgi:hypothetical protein
MKTKTLLIAGATLALSVAMSQAQYSFVTMNIPGAAAHSLVCIPWSQSPNPTSALEFLAYLRGGETLTFWNGSEYYLYTYQGYGVGTGMGYPSDFTDGSYPPTHNIPGEVYDSADVLYWTPDPIFTVGKSFWIMNPGAEIHCTLLGSGSLAASVPIHGNGSANFVGNAMPTPASGNAEGAAINMTANFAGGETVYVWNGSGYYIYCFQGAGVGTGLGYWSDFTDGSYPPTHNIPGEVYDSADDLYWTPPLNLNIGQGLMIYNPNADESWSENIIW